MNSIIPAEINAQLSMALNIIERNLESTLLAVHLYGSALDGGLKPYSDIDLLVTLSAPLNDVTRQALFNDLLTISAPPGNSETFRALEVTIVVRDEIVPWHYPPKRELQFGEWLRNDIVAGIFEPATIDIDLTILLTKVRQHGIALKGASAQVFFDPIPACDLLKTLAETLELWNSPTDWMGDERHVVLTLARIWYSVATGQIAPKDVAADWAMEFLPLENRAVLFEARQAYLGRGEDRLAVRVEEVAEFILFVKREVSKMLNYPGC